MSDSLPSATSIATSPANSIGERLRETREARGLTLTDIAATLRIKPVFLEALEAGQPDRLPTATHASGFLRSYARYLEVELTDTARTPLLPPAPQLTPPAAVTPNRWVAVIPPVLVIGGILLLYGLWQWLQPAPPAPITPPPKSLGRLEPLEPKSDAKAEAAVEPIAEPQAAASAEIKPEPAVAATPVLNAEPAVKTPAQKAEPKVEPKLAAQDQTAPPPAKATVDPAITVRAVKDSWVQITDANGRQLFSRLMRAGETWRAPAQPGLKLSTGNAGGLVIVKDGKSSGALGATAQVIRNLPLAGAAAVQSPKAVVKPEPEDDFPFASIGEDEAQ